jgi:REP element-mobilizing transposase RayT
MLRVSSLRPAAPSRNRRHFIAITTHRRQRLFDNAFIVSRTLGEFLRSASSRNVAVVAYCFLPNQLDLLVECRSANANLPLFVELAKHRSAHLHKQSSGQLLWQDGFDARPLLPSENLKRAARYVLEHPVRAGLVRDPRRYPYSGSAIWTATELLATTWPDPRGTRRSQS